MLRQHGISMAQSDFYRNLGLLEGRNWFSMGCVGLPRSPTHRIVRFVAQESRTGLRFQSMRMPQRVSNIPKEPKYQSSHFVDNWAQKNLLD